jgi:hypothetical protein
VWDKHCELSLITEVTAPRFINVEDEPARQILDSPGQVRVPCHNGIWIYGDPLRLHWGSGYRLDRSDVGDTMPQRVGGNRDSAVVSEAISSEYLMAFIAACLPCTTLSIQAVTSGEKMAGRPGSRCSWAAQWY